MGPNDPFARLSRDSHARPSHARSSDATAIRRRAPSAVWIGGALGAVVGALILAIGLPRTSLVVLLALIGVAIAHFFFGRGRAAT
jgi:uncharacterized membrane protein